MEGTSRTNIWTPTNQTKDVQPTVEPEPPSKHPNSNPPPHASSAHTKSLDADSFVSMENGTVYTGDPLWILHKQIKKLMEEMNEEWKLWKIPKSRLSAIENTNHPTTPISQHCQPNCLRVLNPRESWVAVQRKWTPTYSSKGSIRAKIFFGLIRQHPIASFPPKIILDVCIWGNYAGSATNHVTTVPATTQLQDCQVCSPKRISWIWGVKFKVFANWFGIYLLAKNHLLPNDQRKLAFYIFYLACLLIR